MRSGLLALAAGALCACSPEPETAAPAGPLALDCAAGFEALAAQIQDRPGIRPAPVEPREPYLAYSESDSSAAYILTTAGAPAHPAILRQIPVRGPDGRVMAHDGCAFGDPEAYEQFKSYWDAVAEAR